MCVGNRHPETVTHLRITDIYEKSISKSNLPICNHLLIKGRPLFVRSHQSHVLFLYKETNCVSQFKVNGSLNLTQKLIDNRNVNGVLVPIISTNITYYSWINLLGKELKGRWSELRGRIGSYQLLISGHHRNRSDMVLTLANTYLKYLFLLYYDESLKTRYDVQEDTKVQIHEDDTDYTDAFCLVVSFFTRGQFWHSGSVVTRICLCVHARVRLSVHVSTSLSGW